MTCYLRFYLTSFQLLHFPFTSLTTVTKVIYFLENSLCKGTIGLRLCNFHFLSKEWNKAHCQCSINVSSVSLLNIHLINIHYRSIHNCHQSNDRQRNLIFPYFENLTQTQFHGIIHKKKKRESCFLNLFFTYIKLNSKCSYIFCLWFCFKSMKDILLEKSYNVYKTSVDPFCLGHSLHVL